MKKNKKKITDAVAILHESFVKGDIGRLASIEAEREKVKIAEQVYALRTERGLTQKELATMMGTTQSVISRLENTDYESERIETLQKLAAALQCHLEVRFVPEENSPSTKQDKNDGTSQVSEDKYTWNESPSNGVCNWFWRERDIQFG